MGPSGWPPLSFPHSGSFSELYSGQGKPVIKPQIPDYSLSLIAAVWPSTQPTLLSLRIPFCSYGVPALIPSALVSPAPRTAPILPQTLRSTSQSLTSSPSSPGLSPSCVAQRHEDVSPNTVLASARTPLSLNPSTLCSWLPAASGPASSSSLSPLCSPSTWILSTPQ